MLKVLLLSLLFLPTSHSYANALIDLNALGAESVTVIEKAYAQEVNVNGGVDKVEVITKQRGLLLALVPITFTVKAVAYPNGAVEIYYPWYSSITIDHNEEIKARVKIAVDTALKSRLVGSVKAEGKSNNPRFSPEEAVVVEKKIIEILSGSVKNNSTTE